MFGKSLLENPFDKMNVAAATSIFSNTSSIAMSTYIETGQLPPEAAPTAALMKEMDNFFDCFNSSDKVNMCKPLKSGITRTSEHWDFLENLKLKIEEALFIPSTCTDPSKAKQESQETLTTQQRYPPCLNGVISNINALRLIWDRLESIGFEYLLTRKVNQDPLENAFAGFRRSCGSNDSPSAREFGICVKYYSARRTIDCISGANCEVDDEDTPLEDMPSSLVQLTPENEGTIFLREDPEEESMNYSQFKPDPLETQCVYADHPFKSLNPDSELPNLPTLNGLNYILGYAASKLKHKKCKRKLCLKHSCEGLQEDDYLFCRLKHYLNARGFNYPNKKAVEIGLTLTMAFEQQFFEFINTSRFGVKKRLKEYISRENYKDVACALCLERYIDCILNILLSGQTSKMMNAYKRKNSTENRRKLKKAKRMNFSLKRTALIKVNEKGKTKVKPKITKTKRKINCRKKVETGNRKIKEQKRKISLTEHEKREIKAKSRSSRADCFNKNRKEITDKSIHIISEDTSQNLLKQQDQPQPEQTSDTNIISDKILNIPDAVQGSSKSVNYKNNSAQDKALLAFERFANSLPEIEEFYCEMKNLHHLPLESIFATLDYYRNELLLIYNRYKKFSYSQLVSLKEEDNLDLVTWEDAELILDGDQAYLMSKHLRTQLVPEEEWSQVSDFIVDVLIWEWATRIFQETYKMSRQAAQYQFKRQEQSRIVNNEVPFDV